MKKVFTPILSLIIAAAGLLFALYGYSQGEAGTVFENAVRICLECIGIG